MDYYSEFKEQNERNKKRGRPVRVSESKVAGYEAIVEYKDTKECVMTGIGKVLQMVEQGLVCVTNPSVFKKVFPKEKVPMSEVQCWYNYYGEGKGAINKILREYGATSLNYKKFLKKGYDSLIVTNALVGIKEQRIIPSEIVVFDTALIEIVPEGTKGRNIAYHNTTAQFDAFSLKYVGCAHGACYGDGIYFSTVPLEEYGRTITVRLHIKNPYRIKDLNNVESIYKYVNALLA